MKTEQKPLQTGLGNRTKAREIIGNHRFDGKTVVITGGHSGIGLVTTKALSGAGATVVVGARNVDKARDVLGGLENVTFIGLNLADPRSIDSFSDFVLESHSRVDILINNAGVMALPTLERDARGYELQFATNHLGHFQLTAKLWGALKRSKNARVIALSSSGHRYSPVHFEDPHFNRRPYEKWSAYGQSKTANSLFAVELDRRGEPFGIRAFSVHPGRIPSTDLKRFMTFREIFFGMLRALIPVKNRIHIKTLEEGAATTLWAATSPDLAGKGGVYCADCDISPLVHQASSGDNSVRDYAVDSAMAAQLWEASEKMTGIKYD